MAKFRKFGEFGTRVRDEATGATKIVFDDEMPAFLAANQQQIQKREATKQGLAQAWQQSAQIQQNLLKQKAAEEAAKRAEQLKRDELDASVRDRDIKNRLSYNSQQIQERAGLRRDNLQRASLQDAMTRFAGEMGFKQRAQDQNFSNAQQQLRLQQRAQDNSMFNAEAGRELTREQMQQSATQFADRMGLDYQKLDLDQQQFLLNLAQQNSQFDATNRRAYDQMDMQQGQFDATMQQRTAEALAKMDLDWARFDSDGAYRQESLAQAAELAMIQNQERGRQFDLGLAEQVRGREQQDQYNNRRMDLAESEFGLSAGEVADKRRVQVQQALNMAQNLNPEGMKKLQEYKNKVGGMLKAAGNLRPQQQAEMYGQILNQLDSEYWDAYQQPMFTPQNDVDARSVDTPAGPGLYDAETGRVDVFNMGDSAATVGPVDLTQPVTKQQISSELMKNPEKYDAYESQVITGLQESYDEQMTLWQDAESKRVLPTDPANPYKKPVPPTNDDVKAAMEQGIISMVERRNTVRGLTQPQIPQNAGTLMGQRMDDPAVQAQMRDLQIKAFGTTPQDQQTSPEVQQIMQSPEAQDWAPKGQQSKPAKKPINPPRQQQTLGARKQPKITSFKMDKDVYKVMDDLGISDSRKQVAAGRQRAIEENKPHVSNAKKQHLDLWKKQGARVIPNQVFENLNEDMVNSVPLLWLDEQGIFQTKVDLVKRLRAQQSSEAEKRFFQDALSNPTQPVLGPNF